MGGKGGCFRCRDQCKSSIVRRVSRSLEGVDVETRWRAEGTVEGLERQAEGLGRCCTAGGSHCGLWAGLSHCRREILGQGQRREGS